MDTNSKPEGYVFGRPTLYKPEYCQMLIDHGKQGLSYESFAGVVGVRKQTLYDWEDKYEEFKEAKDLGHSFCRLFWEKLGVAGTIGKIQGFNVTAWIYNMKNRFNDSWKDKQPGEPGDVNLIQNNLNIHGIEQDKARTIDEFFVEAIPSPETQYVESFARNLNEKKSGLLVKKKGT